MLKLESVSKTYTIKRNSSHVSALNNINVSFGRHGLVSIVGKSGSGKTTLLNIIGGLDHYTDGDLIIDSKSTRNFKCNRNKNHKTYDNCTNRKYTFICRTNLSNNAK